MKTTVVLGSPRIKSNSTAIANMLIESLGSNINSIVRHTLNNLTFRGCQACMACKKTSEVCIVNDDLSTVLTDVIASDLVILTSPVYIGEINAQTKGFVDRLYSFLKPDFRTNPNPGRLTVGKKIVFIVTQGSPDSTAFADIVTRYSTVLKRTGFTDVITLRAIGVGPQTDIAKNTDVLQLINQTVSKIVGS